MRTWKVWFNDWHSGKNHSVKVNATGIIFAIDAAQKKMMEKGLAFFGWELWKIEMV